MTESQEIEQRVRLRDVEAGDLPIYFENQRDPVAVEMAAFPARDHEAFTAHWETVLADETNLTRTVLLDGEVAGGLFSWMADDGREVGYWLGRSSGARASRPRRSPRSCARSTNGRCSRTSRRTMSDRSGCSRSAASPERAARSEPTMASRSSPWCLEPRRMDDDEGLLRHAGLTWAELDQSASRYATSVRHVAGSGSASGSVR